MRVKTNENAFTLIELLAVIFIIGMISVIAVPAIQKVTLQSKDELHQNQINNIINAAKNWAAQNAMLLPQEEGEKLFLTLGQLKMAGLIDKDIADPKNKRLFANDMEIEITNDLNSFEYKIINKKEGVKLPDNNNFPYITLNGSTHEIVELKTSYIEKGAVAREVDGTTITDISITVYNIDGTTAQQINTNAERQYKVKYVVQHNGQMNSLIRTVSVKDTTPPVLTVPKDIQINAKDVSGFNLMSGVSATDNSGITPTITTSGQIKPIEGTYYITYTAKDESGNVSSKTRKIIVKK